MKRRFVLKSMLALPAAAATGIAQKDLTAARDKGLPAGPPLVPPGINETPNTPVVTAVEIADNVPGTFTPEQLSALTKLGELMVPSWNGLPGASEAGAAEFLDFLIGCSPQSRTNLYRNGLDALNKSAQQKFGSPFASLNAEQADTLLSPLRQPRTFQSASGDGLSAFLQAAKGDFLRATQNSRPYIDAVSQVRRPRNASRFYWYSID